MLAASATVGVNHCRSADERIVCWEFRRFLFLLCHWSFAMPGSQISRRNVVTAIGTALCGFGALGTWHRASADDKKDEKKAGEKKEDAEEEIPLKKVPDVVRKAADKAVGKVKWESAHLVTEDGEKLYELEGTDSKGRIVVVTVTPEGTVDEIVTEIALKDVPETVTSALKEKMPRFKAKLAFEISEDGTVTGYDLEGRRPRDKHDIAVYVSADGKTVEIDEDE